jgi:type I restriction enzyme S subunit
MTQTDVRNIEIPLPPLAEQKKIVAKIERAFAKIDEAIRLREEALEATANLLSATLHEIFEEGKKSYSLEELGRVAKLVRGPFGGSLKKEIFVRDGDCVYEQGNVINNDLVNFRYYIKPTKFEEMKRFAVASGDVLMSCSGTIGKLVIIPSEYKQGIINQALLKMTPNARVNAQYLVYALKDYLSLNNTHVKGMAIKNIAAVKELKVLKIPLPPFGTQKKIVARLDALSAKVRTLQEAQSTQLADLKALKQSILHEAFNPTE